MNGTRSDEEGRDEGATRPTRPTSTKLPPGELRKFVLIGVPALGLSSAATTLDAYVPVLARELTSSRAVIGALVGGEGFVSLLLPIWIGAASDRVETRLGARLPFMLGTAPIAALALACMPFARSLPVLAVAVGIHYLAYFTYYAPYRALESDLVSRQHSGRANAVVGIFRALGMGGGLVGGALLLQLWRPLPFWGAAAILILTTAISVVGLRRLVARKSPDGRGDRRPASALHVDRWLRCDVARHRKLHTAQHRVPEGREARGEPSSPRHASRLWGRLISPPGRIKPTSTSTLGEPSASTSA